MTGYDERLKRVSVQNAPGLVRNTDTGVILNTNEAGYNIILEKRRHDKEMRSIKDEMSELKEMVRKLAK